MKNFLRSIFVLMVAGIISLGLIQPVSATPSDIDALKQGVIAWETGWSAGDILFTMDRVDNTFSKSRTTCTRLVRPLVRGDLPCFEHCSSPPQFWRLQEWDTGQDHFRQRT